ncbi:MAG: HAD-IIB family hydrolase [Thermodesulfobacteriota bacterium]|nr:HAD-IIB family hydrolase [Thermodesulfobacteriota bacterium]
MTHDKLYIQMFSIHGLVRESNMEMGRDADTGGQVKYVVELARHLSQREDVAQVDLFTRLIEDKTVSSDYARPVKEVNEKFRIVRVRCGGKKYMRKELLWPHLDEYVDKTIQFIKTEDRLPDIVHGHYADAGYVAAQLAQLFNINFIFTGHSLGRSKKARLLNDGMKEADIIKKYKIDERIRVEEDVLKTSDLIIASTRQEVEEQYGAYVDSHMPGFKVIPPGLDIERFYPYYHDIVSDANGKKEEEKFARASVIEELNRFFMYPDRPLILALSRPDKRKNISGLIQAYGEDRELTSIANLAIFAGIRKDISDKEENEKEVLTMMLLSMDKYDLYGKMAIPKKHDFEYEVPELYRIAAEKKGVFVNPALTEPFGLTLIEAAATGLPVVATNDGGPIDIMDNCDCGILVDPTKTRDISNAIKKIITDGDRWKTYSKNGTINVRKHYTWNSHADTYVREVQDLIKASGETGMDVARPSDAIGRRIMGLDYFVITDIDNTLTGEDNSHLDELMKMLGKHRDKIGFGVATGRTMESAVAHLESLGIDPPDVIISSVGSELYYGKDLHFSNGWATHISKSWDREKIHELLEDLDFLKYQEDDTQRKFKISYDMKPGKDRLATVHNILLKHKCRYNLIYSHNKYVDILPYRASKGKAIRYLSYKWMIPLSNFLVCGDSGNDEEMLKGDVKAVVVGNYSEELAPLKGSRNIYFAEAPCADGIIEGIGHYKFIEKAINK